MSRRVAYAAPLLLGALLAACTGGPGVTAPPTTAVSGTPTATAAPPATPTATPMTTPIETPVPVPTATAVGGEVSLSPDQSLLELMPDEIGGQALSTDSASGQDVLDLLLVADEEAFNDFLADIGTTIDQVSVARAFAFVPGPTATDLGGIQILALRVPEVPADTTVDRFVELVQSTVPDATTEPATIAGKQVTAIVDPANVATTVYVYAVRDVVFMVGGNPPPLVEEAFAKLP